MKGDLYLCVQKIQKKKFALVNLANVNHVDVQKKILNVVKKNLAAVTKANVAKKKKNLLAKLKNLAAAANN
ncbi:MAG: hypothetical protein K2L64_00830 [Ureaplasma sp.]|nr:hypothetical protein [Ureaplasma sp.]